MDKLSLINALENLEQKQHIKIGYEVKEVLDILDMPCDRKTEKRTRGLLRSLISKQKYPEILTAGNDDIVYCPDGKWSGKYKLSKYR